MRDTPPGGFVDFVVARGPALHRTAVLLTGQEQVAEDLVQIALAKAWRPSYCGPDPGSSVRLRLALPHSTVITIPVRNLGGAAKPIYAPSCTPALGETRLSVERFGYHQG
jgi:hypothetical protein